MKRWSGSTRGPEPGSACLPRNSARNRAERLASHRAEQLPQSPATSARDLHLRTAEDLGEPLHRGPKAASAPGELEPRHRPSRREVRRSEVRRGARGLAARPGRLGANAALSLKKRQLLVRRVLDEGWSLAKAAAAAVLSEPMSRKWAQRYRSEGEFGLLDRPSAAHDVHNRTPEDRIQVICALRRLRMSGAEIAAILAMPETTVSGILTRSGLGRLGRLGMEPAQRYERARPGELFHIRREEARADRRWCRAPGRRASSTPAQASQDRRLGRAAQFGAPQWIAWSGPAAASRAEGERATSSASSRASVCPPPCPPP